MLPVFVALELLSLADKGLGQSDRDRKERETGFDARISSNAQRMLEEGRQIFRFDTFATLLGVVNHYNDFKRLTLSEQEKRDLVEFLKSL